MKTFLILSVRERVIDEKRITTMKVEYIYFGTRMDRAKYIVQRFSYALQGRVLDVGCDKALLRGLLPHVTYTGIDINGDPDIKVNLDDCERLPFDNDAFDCVLCTDVLEHLDALHAVFSELIRVTRTYLIISLTNNWINAVGPLRKGNGSILYYGLPLDPPEDRHKWFFNISDSIDFITAQTGRHPLVIREMHVNESPSPAISRKLRSLQYPKQIHYLNR